MQHGKSTKFSFSVLVLITGLSSGQADGIMGKKAAERIETMLANYHTHTTFCDGSSTAEEVIQYAIDRGFDAIGFSGHCTTDFDLRYCMRDTAGYVAEINRLKEAYRGKIQIYLGIEEDAFAPVHRPDFDYIIGSAHYIHHSDGYFPVDSGLDLWQNALDLFDGDSAAFAAHYYRDFCSYILSRNPDIVGHFDLITKYEETNGGVLFSNPRYWEAAEKYLLQVASPDRLFEVNNGAICRGLRTTPYPHERLLHLLHRQGSGIILSSDAHRADTLDFQFTQTEELLRQIGFTHVYVLLDGTFQKRPL